MGNKFATFITNLNAYTFGSSNSTSKIFHIGAYFHMYKIVPEPGYKMLHCV